MKLLSAVVLLMVFISLQLFAQTFAKITTGSVVSDGGASRSANWIDYDKDGWLDLFVSNGLEGGQQNFLYRNNRGGAFTKITNDVIVTFAQPYDGASWADADGDGDLDCFVVAWYDSNNTYFQNNGDGTFTRANIGGPVSDRGFSEACSWADYDNDGRLDLYVSNSGSPSLGAKRNFLYRNTVSGFAKVDTGMIVTDQFYSRGVTWIDYDNDGDQDMFVVNERGLNENLYRNMLTETGTAFFTKITAGQLVNDGGNSMSASWADADNDGDLDVFIATGWPANSLNAFYLNNGDRTFTKVVNDTIVKLPGYHMGSAWSDFDNDGDLDLFVTTAYAPSATKNELYKNMLRETGTLSFQRVGTGDIANDLGWSYGCAWGDYDRDGDLDLFISKTLNENENNALYRNDNANGNHWILINCIGAGLNRSAIGAKVRVKATIDGTVVWQMRVVEGQSGYCGQNLQLHFGLGNATRIDSMRIEWSTGAVESHANVSVDRVVNATQNGGITSVGQLHDVAPKEFELRQNYPNPFNPMTNLGFRIGDRGLTTLRVFDVLGREVATLVNEVKSAGNYAVDWNADDVASGVYYYTLQAGSFRDTKKMILLR